MSRLKTKFFFWMWLGFGAATNPLWGAITVDVADAPGNDLTLTLSSIAGARKSLRVNIYELQSPEIARAVIDRVNQNVTVEMIVEGEPMEGVSKQYRSLEAQIIAAMRDRGTQNHYYLMTGHSGSGSKRRYHYNHAKYAVVDGQAVLVGSENYSPTGQPARGKVGNRGWEVFVHDSEVARTFNAIFETDRNASFGDIVDLTLAGPPAPQVAGIQSDDHISLPPAGPRGLPADAVEVIASPDNSLNGLVAAIRSANDHLEVELLSFAPQWGFGTHPPPPSSPLFAALLGAAKRGVKVRVLLNDDRAFIPEGSTAPLRNKLAAEKFNAAAQAAGVELEVRVANLKAMGVDYIHNKGMLIGNSQTLISSINWNENSVERNRETAVLVTSNAVHDYFSRLFEKDWEGSAP